MRIGWTSFRGPVRGFGTAPLAAAALIAPLVAVAALGAWLAAPEPDDADDQDASPLSSALFLTAQDVHAAETPSVPSAAKQPSPSPASAAPTDEPATVGIAKASDKALESTPDAKPEKSPLDGLRIASQSWRRGGLGSKALVTLTLRNANDFAVKDIELECAFIRSDGSPVTERTRLIPDTIPMRSRKTYPNMLIGHVNINANKAKCSVVTASRI